MADRRRVTDRPRFPANPFEQQSDRGDGPLSDRARAHPPKRRAEGERRCQCDCAGRQYREVTQISPALDTTSTTVEVWVQVPNPDGRLRPGSSQRVEIIARTVPSALVIPEAAVLTSSLGTTSVMVIDPENKPHKETVTLGIRDSGKVQVTDGLQNGQRVVTTGAFELAKLDESVLAKTNVRIQPPKEEEDEK